jgi:uncharacterized membrane protein
MVILALLVRLPLGLVAATGVAIIAGHNLIDPHFREWSEAAQASPLGWLWQVLYFGGGFRLFGSGPPLIILYSLVPWIGVMAAGYAFGGVMLQDPARRDRLCLSIGFGATLLFLVLRGFNLYGNPFPWGGPDSRLPLLLSFLSTNKYPASLLFLTMTLGPTIALLPLLERARGAVARWLTIFGRVPLFYYLLHIPLIHPGRGTDLDWCGRPQDTAWLFSQPPDDVADVPAGLQVEPGTPVRGDADSRRDPVLPLPLVRRKRRRQESIPLLRFL